MTQSGRAYFVAVLLFLLTLIVFFRPVLAQSDVLPQEQVLAPAPAAMFIPTSGWLVGDATAIPREVAQGEAAMPCVMMNQYDNGFIVRISGGGGRIIAMAVDFRQPAFTAGASYDVVLGVPPHLSRTVEAMAYNEATLVFNVQDVEGLYKSLAGGHAITLGIAGNDMAFALMNVGEGLRRIEECYYPDVGRDPVMQEASNPVQPQQPQALNNVEPAAGGGAQEAPQNEQKAVSTGYRLARTWASPDNAGQPAPSQARDIVAPAAETVKNDAGEKRWRAIRGASLRDVLGAWSKQAQMDLIWMPEQDFPVKQSAGLDGTFEEAVTNLLGQYEGESARPVGKIYDGAESGRKVLLIEGADAEGVGKRDGETM